LQPTLDVQIAKIRLSCTSALTVKNQSGQVAALLRLNQKKRKRISMAKNTGNGRRNGEVCDRSQVFNPVTKLWTKRDSATGEFIGVNESGKPYKGVRKEK
jgi:hypothetical protein